MFKWRALFLAALKGVWACATLEELPLIGLCKIQWWESHFAEFRRLGFKAELADGAGKQTVQLGWSLPECLGNFNNTLAPQGLGCSAVHESPSG